MKNGLQKLKSDERDLLMKATNALVESLNLQISVNFSANDKPSTIELSLPNQKKKYIFEPYFTKEANNTVTLGLAKMHSDTSRKKIVLISEFVSPQVAKKFRELDIPFIDTVGNTYINEQGLFVFIAGNLLSKTTSEKFISRAGMEVLFALLSIPNFESENYRKISDFSRVSLGAVALTMKGLGDQGFLITRRKKRILIRKTELVNIWVQNYPQILRPKYSFSTLPLRLKPNWWQEVDLTKYDAYWGGEVAGAKMTKFIEPQHFTIYNLSTEFTDYLIKECVASNEITKVEFMFKFWNFPTKPDIAPPLLVYADLVATAEPRNLEVAKMIYDEHIIKLIGENS